MEKKKVEITGEDYFPIGHVAIRVHLSIDDEGCDFDDSFLLLDESAIANLDELIDTSCAIPILNRNNKKVEFRY